MKSGQGKVTVDYPQQLALREDAILAISVPFRATGASIEVASVFKGEIIDIEPGDYELVYQTGRNGAVPWVELQFIAHKIAEASILQGAQLLKPPDKLLMSAEPA